MAADAPDGEMEWRPVTEEQRARAEAALAQLKADLAREMNQPSPHGSGSERFSGPMGYYAEGNLQPPLTPEEKARIAAARRGELDGREPDR